MTNTQSLLPCPFCGCKAVASINKDESLWSHDVVDWTRVHCTNDECNAQTEATCEGYEPSAIEVWNYRTPKQEVQEPSHRETVDVVGVRSNGEHVNLEKIAMPPRMKAREIAIEQFGSFKDDDGSDAEMCFGALEYFLEWLIRQGWSKAPPPAPAPLSDDAKDAARYRWLRATTNYVTSNGERIDVRNMPEKWDAAIDAAIAAQGGKA